MLLFYCFGFILVCFDFGSVLVTYCSFVSVLVFGFRFVGFDWFLVLLCCFGSFGFLSEMVI